MATGRLFLWSAAHGEWVSCPPDEITWLDRRMLSDDKDVTLHRAPRCAGLRFVHHRWELFSRDTTYRVYLAPDAGGTQPGAEAVQRTACHVLPVAPVRYEALPVTLADARRSLELVTALYHSAATDTIVTLPIGPDHPKYHGWRP